MGLHASFELRTRAGIPKIGPLGPELSRTLKHAYLACVSYVDAQIGRMVAALEEAGVRDNTIIIVWGDHGWHLGDMGVWGKATNYEVGDPSSLDDLDARHAHGHSRPHDRRAGRVGRHVSDALRTGGDPAAAASGRAQFRAPARRSRSSLEERRPSASSRIRRCGNGRPIRFPKACERPGSAR